jgi:heme oxygenase
MLSLGLAADLQALSVSVPEVACAPVTSLPPLSEFAGALSACYVLEGSALGSQFMLPVLKKTLGDAMAGTDCFFRGRGAETVAFWKKFRAALDLYGETHPEQKAVGPWMRP